jgi:hypothetical protein
MTFLITAVVFNAEIHQQLSTVCCNTGCPNGVQFPGRSKLILHDARNAVACTAVTDKNNHHAEDCVLIKAKYVTAD